MLCCCRKLGCSCFVCCTLTDKSGAISRQSSLEKVSGKAQESARNIVTLCCCCCCLAFTVPVDLSTVSATHEQNREPTEVRAVSTYATYGTVVRYVADDPTPTPTVTCAKTLRLVPGAHDESVAHCFSVHRSYRSSESLQTVLVQNASINRLLPVNYSSFCRLCSLLSAYDPPFSTIYCQLPYFYCTSTEH